MDFCDCTIHLYHLYHLLSLKSMSQCFKAETCYNECPMWFSFVIAVGFIWYILLIVWIKSLNNFNCTRKHYIQADELQNIVT